MSQTRVLLIEDEESIRMALGDVLRTEGYGVTEAPDGEVGLEMALREGPDVVLLDLMLPKLSGFEVLRALREDRLSTAVIILSARGEESTRIQGFEYGADDYMVKPFSTKELLLRLRALLARTEGDVPGVETKEELVRFGQIKIDFRRYSIENGGQRYGLSRLELDLLRCFLDNEDKALTRDFLLNSVWGEDRGETDRTVDTHVLRLRKKLERDLKNPRHLVTIHKVGYRFSRRS